MTRCCDELLYECFGEIISPVIGYCEDTVGKKIVFCNGPIMQFDASLTQSPQSPATLGSPANKKFSHDVMSAILVFQNNNTVAMQKFSFVPSFQFSLVPYLLAMSVKTRYISLSSQSWLYKTHGGEWLSVEGNNYSGDSRELKQRQRERQNRNRFRLAKQQLHAYLYISLPSLLD